MKYSIEYDISEQLNIKLKKMNIMLIKTKEEIKEKLKNKKYDVIYINFQNNSINGVINKESNNYFFKILDKQDFYYEITGYIQIKKTLPVNKIIDILEFKNCNIIVYEYENTINKNEGLLNDFFVKNDFIQGCIERKVTNRIINLYKKTYKKTVIKENYPMQKFFQNRIESRLKKWYEDEKIFDYNVVINDIRSKKTKEIINECINFFSVNHKLECSLTQGDPNTLNIGIKPILIADEYFCPKYHPRSYYNHEEAFKNINKFTPDIRYEINDKKKEIKIQSNIKTSHVRYQFVRDYIKMLRKLDIKIGKDMIYFLIMRILCIFDIRSMEKDDYFYSIFILHYIYQNIQNDTYSSLEKIINSFYLIK